MSSAIPWKSPNDMQPADGDYIIALSWHWKQAYPSSMEIIGGVVESYIEGHSGKRVWRCQTEDYSGNGSYAEDAEDIEAWCYAEEFRVAFPEFLKINEELPK